VTLHIDNLRGDNAHHQCETMFKAFARALRTAVEADARAAGMMQAGDFAPGAGAHFINYSGVNINADGSVNPNNPAAYIYDGINPTSRLVGVMYTSLASGDAPAGFPGPNDHWHLHQNLCIKYGAAGISVPFAPDRDVTKEQCDAVHGPGAWSPRTVTTYVFAPASGAIQSEIAAVRRARPSFGTGRNVPPSPRRLNPAAAARSAPGRGRGGRRA